MGAEILKHEAASMTRTRYKMEVGANILFSFRGESEGESVIHII